MAQKLTDEIIDAAIEGFESQKARLDQKISELRAMRSGNHEGPSETASEAAPRKRRKFSAAAIARMRAAQKARWEKIRGESQPAQVTATQPAKPKRKLSAAARAKLVANLKKARAAKAAKAKSTAGKKKVAGRRTAVKKMATAAPVTA